MPLLLLVTLALQQPRPAAVSIGEARPFQPRIEWAALPLDVPRPQRDSIRFGYLVVPQDHSNPAGATIRIAFAVLPARAPNPLPDPVVSIVGGPGLPGIELHMHFRLAGPHPIDVYRDRRNLVVVDPRGHGFSEPRTCPELNGVEPEFNSTAEAERLWLEKLTNCRTRLLANGIRLETLSAAQVAHDLELLRQALGVPQLNLSGASYGSRLAAEAMRQVPSAIRSVYMAGPVPPARYRGGNEPEVAEEVLGALFRRCDADARCRAAYPHLKSEYDTLLARMRSNPIRLRLRRSSSAVDEVVVDEDLLRQGLADLLNNRQLAAGVPLLIHTFIEQGAEFLERVAPQLEQVLQAPEPVAAGTHLAFWCNDGVVTNTSNDRLRQRCRTWLGDAWNGRGTDPVRSDIPVLMMTGEFDSRTPPSYARFLAAGLTKAQSRIIPWYGHEVPPGCSFRISHDFFDAPEREPQSSCLDSIKPIEFVTDVVPSRSVAKGVARIWRKPWFALFPGAAALLLLVPAVGIPVREFRARRRVRRGGDWIGTIAFLLLVGVGLLLAFGLPAAVFASMRRSAFIPLVGIPTMWAWLLALPWLLLVLTATIGSLVLSGRLGGPHSPPAFLRWSSLLGASLVLALCAFGRFAS